MRNKKTNIKPTFPSPASLLPSRLLSHPWAAQEGHGMGGCGQSITSPLCPSFLLTHITCSSVGSPHRLQSFRRKICSIVGSLQATVPPGHIHVLWYESSTGCRGCWLWHALAMGCKGVSAPECGTPPPPTLVFPLLFPTLSVACSSACVALFALP